MQGRIKSIRRFAANACLPWLMLNFVYSLSHAQYPTVLPTGATNQTSPEIGDVQGIQRFGEQLISDPDQGIGFTYRVLPTAKPNSEWNQSSLLWAMAHLEEAQTLKEYYYQLAILQQQRQVESDTKKIDDLNRQIEYCQLKIQQLGTGLQLTLGEQPTPSMFGRYATPNVPLIGQRNYGPTNLRMAASAGAIQPFTASQAYLPLATDALKGFGVGGTLSTDPNGQPLVTLYNQPLIQIKVRVIEATRLNSAEFRSVLERLGKRQDDSLVTSNNLNSNKQSWRAGTQFGKSNNIIGEASLPATNNPTAANPSNFASITGNGALVNLTTAHINFLTNMLVTEFKSDVLTVPEVVTLNGQLVEFVVGSNRPLPLGLTFVQANGAVRQDVFYKHIGSIMRITPRIVNWGKNGEGSGQAPLVAQEVNNWNRLAKWMSDERQLLIDPELKKSLAKYVDKATPVPTDDKIKMLTALEQFPSQELRERIWATDPAVAQAAPQAHPAGQLEYAVHHAPNSAGPGSTVAPADWQNSMSPDNPQVVTAEGACTVPTSDTILRIPSGMACDWKPEDCTIDLEIMLRDSDLKADGVTEAANAVSNIVQVKSGHGVVMGGLLASREIESVSKVPLLGDLPAVGFLFRTKSLDRAKAELIIMIEAQVLPPTSDPETIQKTAADFQLAQGYVMGELLDNPLQAGMYRAGFGSYLPPCRAGEDLYWARHGQRMRKVVTEIDDTLK